MDPAEPKFDSEGQKIEQGLEIEIDIKSGNNKTNISNLQYLQNLFWHKQKKNVTVRAK